MIETAHRAHLFPGIYPDWGTPEGLFLPLEAEFGFTLDVAASAWNAKCRRYFTEDEDAVSREWAPNLCWMNPPYGRSLPRWTGKAVEEAANGALVVGLLPVRSDTAWWHDHVLPHAEVRFIRGRVEFVPPRGLSVSRSRATFPSAIVIWRPGR